MVDIARMPFMVNSNLARICSFFLILHKIMLQCIRVAYTKTPAPKLFIKQTVNENN